MQDDNNASLSGGSFLVAWQLKDKHVLIVGGGQVASGRIESILIADAFITLVSPKSDLHPTTSSLIHHYPNRILFHDRLFSADDLLNIDVVLTAIDDVQTSQEICALARERRIPINVADIPPSCDFYFGSQIHQGPLQIMISTNGQSPKLANLIRKQIEDNLAPHSGQAIEKVGKLRSKLRERAPGVGGELGKRRMRWMVDVCTSWDMEDLAMLDDDMMVKLLDHGWENNRVPTVVEVGGLHRALRTTTLRGSVLPAAIGFIAGGLISSIAFLVRSRRAVP
jgi:precorrin-2 dehydrogenase / sirohydrochlorin ferrochelatase